MAGDGTRLMRTYDTSSAANLVRYPELARKKWGKVLLVTDNAPRHKSRKVRRYPERNPDVMLLYLPAAGPELGAAGEVRGRAKYRLVTPGFYATLDGPKAAVPGHFSTCAIKAGIYKYLVAACEAKSSPPVSIGTT